MYEYKNHALVEDILTHHVMKSVKNNSSEMIFSIVKDVSN